MGLPNPTVKYALSKGVDLPLMYVYLAGYMSKEKIAECTIWRKGLREYYRKWEPIPIDPETETEQQWASYPIVFLDPFNGPELESISAKGLTSNIPPNAIRDGDYLSVRSANVVVVNIDQFGSDRASWGTPTEMAWALDVFKHPVITIVPENLKGMEKHPFIQRSSWVVNSWEEIIDKKCLEYFYKRMAGAIY